MVKLSELLRKNAEIKRKVKPGLISEAKRIKSIKESLSEIKRIYEDAIIHIRQIMDDIRQGKMIEGGEIANIAETIVDRLRVDNDILIYLTNIYVFYGGKEDYLYSHSVNASILTVNIGLAPEIVYQHHERVDGTGYPEGKKEEEISEYAKVVAIAEIYETIVN